MKVKGGAIAVATTVTGRKTTGGSAIRVYNATGSTKKYESGAAIPIIVLAQADIKDNGGKYRVSAGPAIPMIRVTTRKVQGGAAIPVYPVDANGNYDATF